MASEDVRVERIDKYNIIVGDTRVVANADQEARIRAMNAEERVRFQKIMSGGKDG